MVESFVTKNPIYLKPHPINVEIYGNEAADLNLVESIRIKGLLETIVIERRQYKEFSTDTVGGSASKELHYWEFPCRILSFDNELDEEEALIDINRQRKDIYQRMRRV